MLNRSGARTHAWPRPRSAANHPEHTLSSSRTYVVACRVMYACTVSTFSRVWINRVWLPILLVVSRTGKKKILSPYLYAPENLVSRDGFSRPQSFSTLRLDLVLYECMACMVITVTAGKCNWRHFGWSVRLVGFPQCYLTCRFLTNKIFYLIQGAGGVSE